MKIIITTYPSKPKELKQFIYKVLGSKLAMCINTINYVKSYYWWEGKIVNGQEKMLIIKSNDFNHEKLITFLEKNHPYDVPEILTLDPGQVNNSYLNWINNN